MEHTDKPSMNADRKPVPDLSATLADVDNSLNLAAAAARKRPDVPACHPEAPLTGRKASMLPIRTLLCAVPSLAVCAYAGTPAVQSRRGVASRAPSWRRDFRP